MDLRSPHHALHRRRFPRPRGDGPVGQARPVDPLMVSPPTRGWTVQLGDRACARWGFPAHAGMDLTYTVSGTEGTRFPRPRGDGPRALISCAKPFSVSPPTRGWTPGIAGLTGGQGGFPAHAGMDRRRCLAFGAMARFPRPRGDGPAEQLAHLPVVEVSPPTRGWTQESQGRPLPRIGFPAHAGMDLSPRSTIPRIRWFPRPRGDGPASRRPAYAL